VKQVKKIQVTISTLTEYVSLHKGILSLTDVECKIVATILKHCPDGSFCKKDKRAICEELGESNSYLNVYIDRMLKNLIIVPTSTGYQVCKAVMPQGEEALLIMYNKL